MDTNEQPAKPARKRPNQADEEPDAASPGVFYVPSHVNSVSFGSGCGSPHIPGPGGEVDCEICAAVAADFTFPPPPVPAEGLASSVDQLSGAAVDDSAEAPAEPAEIPQAPGEPSDQKEA